MQSELLDAFIKDLNDIRDYIKFIVLVKNVTNQNKVDDISIIDSRMSELNNHLVKFNVTKRIFEYKSITISLYGILEKYIVVWIKDFIEYLPKIINNYNDLPDNFRNRHFDLSVDLIRYIIEKKNTKYDLLNKEDILKKLHLCIEDHSPFQLNSEAFFPRSGNLKYSKISEAFKSLDINLTASLKIIGKRPEGFLFDIINLDSRGDDLFGLIDDLVERRNCIAHGDDIDDIINIIEFNKYIDFLEEYGKALYQVLVEKLFEIEANCLFEEVEKSKVINVFQSGSILCLELDSKTLKRGDCIIIGLIDGGYIKKEMLDIQIDGVSYDLLEMRGINNVGINLGGGVSKGQTFFIRKYHE